MASLSNYAENKAALCECGCGDPAPIAKRTTGAKGVVKGQPQRFIAGHHMRKMASQIVTDGHKPCSKCEEVKPITEFNRNAKKMSGYDSHCKVCHRLMPSQHGTARRVSARKWYAANKITQRAKVYGISAEQYVEMVARQKGACALCGGPPTDRGLHIDHDHESGAVRALLCQPCNTGLGHFYDDPGRLRLAIDYLERHK